MEVVLIILGIVLFLVYIISRSSHAALTDMGDDKVYKKEVRLFTFEIIFAVLVAIVSIVTSIGNNAPRPTIGPAAYGGLATGILVIVFLLKRFVKVADARETCLKEKRIEEIEKKNPRRTLNRRLSMPCDPETEWRCPRCQSVNSKFTATCGCGYSIHDPANSQIQEQPEYYPDPNMEWDCDTEWKCPNCGTINSNYVGTCGCGCRKNGLPDKPAEPTVETLNKNKKQQYFPNGQEYLVSHRSDRYNHMYCYSSNDLSLKSYRKVIDKALSMGLEIDYLDSTESHDIGDTDYDYGEYPLDKVEAFLTPGYSVDNASIWFKYGEKQFHTRMNFLGCPSFIVYTDSSDESGHIVYELIQSLKPI